MTDFSLHHPLDAIPGIPRKTAERFAKAGVATVQEALLHLPIRYEDRSRLTAIADFRAGDSVQLLAEVADARVTYGRRKMLSVTVIDRAGNACGLRYFHFYPSQLKQFVPGRRGLFYAKAQWGMHGFELHHPEIRWLGDSEVPDLSAGICPVYPTVKSIPQDAWRALLTRILAHFAQEHDDDPLTRQGFMGFWAALRLLHQPDGEHSLTALLDAGHPARRRLAFEELCAHQIGIQRMRAQLRSQQAQALPARHDLHARFLERLPFALTPAQARVCDEIAADVAQDVPMMRLVQGDVGSGKTVVAMMAALHAVAGGCQAAVMAPTELLAEQHMRRFADYLEPLGIRCVLLTGKLGAKARREALAGLASGDAQIAIGTHALFQEQVQYQNLALVIIDEQHRFGVHQRLALNEKAGRGVHQLVMTATPIPRTLAMSSYGELDVSVIDSLPQGRQPVQTAVVANSRREAVIARVGEVCKGGQQAYWVCPLIEESDVIECENAEAIAVQLAASLPHVRVALLHGRMPADARQSVMAAFAAHEYDLLVATTVIEVGVDVANATLMIIENAERFGLSQLHQLRGRVGRGAKASYCLLMYQPPLGETAKRRLAVMRETTDGFVIADEDLRLRGAGELLGTRQTGEAMFRVADLVRDSEQLPHINRLCSEWLATGHPFADTLLARWGGGRERYLAV
ncbi:MAG: ATP-dependent DNA helicase RecG [Cardiobacteriaceae bacterium]|nr:ATP-dependent DNA helicase RecG [Cardiobacteriaceae bacterium]